MSKSINVYTVEGRLTRDSQIRYTNSGSAVLSFSVAYNRIEKDGEKWKDKPCFIDCVLFGKRAESVNQYLTKGVQIFATGELDYQKYETADKQLRTKHQLIVDNFNFGQKPNGIQAVKEEEPPIF